MYPRAQGDAGLSAVLLVEPDEDCQRLITLTLRVGGIRVVAARCVEEAVVIFHALQPPVVILELNLPPSAGLDLIRILVADASQHVAIIALTTITERSWIEQAMAAGCTVYLTKPFSLRTLRLVVMRALG